MHLLKVYKLYILSQKNNVINQFKSKKIIKCKSLKNPEKWLKKNNFF